MPLYRFKCYNCVPYRTFDLFAKIEERDERKDCAVCKKPLLRVLAAPTVHTDLTPYRSPVTGEWVDSKSSRREDLKRAGCLEWEPGIRQDLPRIRESNFEKTMAPVEATIDSTARRLVAEGKLSPL